MTLVIGFLGTAGDVIRRSGSATVTGGGTVSTTTQKNAPRTVGISGGGSVAASGFRRTGGVPAVSHIYIFGGHSYERSDRLSREIHRGYLNLSGGGSVTVLGHKQGRVIAGMAAGGSVSAGGDKQGRVSLEMSDGGVVTVFGKKQHPAQWRAALITALAA